MYLISNSVECLERDNRAKRRNRERETEMERKSERERDTDMERKSEQEREREMERKSERERTIQQKKQPKACVSFATTSHGGTTGRVTLSQELLSSWETLDPIVSPLSIPLLLLSTIPLLLRSTLVSCNTPHSLLTQALVGRKLRKCVWAECGPLFPDC